MSQKSSRQNVVIGGKSPQVITIVDDGADSPAPPANLINDDIHDGRTSMGNGGKGPRGGGVAHRHVGGWQYGRRPRRYTPGKSRVSGSRFGDATTKRRCRLYIGNLPNGVTEKEVRKLFGKYGRMDLCHITQNHYGFVRMESRASAWAAMDALDGHVIQGQALRVRFAFHPAALRIKELGSYVTGDMLDEAFSQFGVVERAVHIVDHNGRGTGEGIVEFERKEACMLALSSIKDGVFLIGTTPHPIDAELLESKDAEHGLEERDMPDAIMREELEQPPRFAQRQSFEYTFGQRFKELYQMEKVRREQLEAELRMERERLESDMDMAYQDYQATMMREDLRRGQEELERIEAARQSRMDEMRRRDEYRRQQFGMGGGGGGFGAPASGMMSHGNNATFGGENMSRLAPLGMNVSDVEVSNLLMCTVQNMDMYQGRFINSSISDVPVMGGGGGFGAPALGMMSHGNNATFGGENMSRLAPLGMNVSDVEVSNLLMCTVQNMDMYQGRFINSSISDVPVMGGGGGFGAPASGMMSHDNNATFGGMPYGGPSSSGWHNGRVGSGWDVGMNSGVVHEQDTNVSDVEYSNLLMCTVQDDSVIYLPSPMPPERLYNGKRRRYQSSCE